MADFINILTTCKGQKYRKRLEACYRRKHLVILSWGVYKDASWKLGPCKWNFMHKSCCNEVPVQRENLILSVRELRGCGGDDCNDITPRYSC